jgi:L-Ala-D/L-Glu epimerase
MNRIIKLSFRRVDRPMRMLFATSLGQKTVSTSVLVRVDLADGCTGQGEVPTSFVFPEETVAAISAVLRGARAALVETDIAEYPAILRKLTALHGRFHMTLAGLEVALFRAALAARGEDEFQHWGGRQGRLETDITIPFIPKGNAMKEWMSRIAPVGFRVHKVKVSGDVETDMAFVLAVRKALDASGRPYVIRLDGNQGYTAQTYQRMLRALAKARVAAELFEQPLRRDDYAGYKALAGCREIPIILDETVFNPADCRRVIEQNLGDGVNIKIAKSGIAGAAAIIRLVRKAGLKLMIGCMTETMVGLSAGICMAAGTGAFEYVDLDSAFLMEKAGRARGIGIDGDSFVMEGFARA